jgi:hypothetical protein
MTIIDIVYINVFKVIFKELKTYNNNNYYIIISILIGGVHFY